MVRPIRLKVDEVYRKLQQLCDVLEGKPETSRDSNPHELSLSETDEILDGLKALFKKSANEEQVRLMTIAPKEWGRQKREKWYVGKIVSYLSVFSHSTKQLDYENHFFCIRFSSNQSQARRSLTLIGNDGALAYPQCLRGNPSLPQKTIDTVIKFYCEDGISRISSNSKDTLQINKTPVAVRFMEMTVLDAFRTFEERFPGVVKRSTFHSLRPRHVKIAAPHETCMCIIHENMNLLLKVCV